MFKKGPQQIVTPELLELFTRPLLFHNLVWLAEPQTKSRGGLVLPMDTIESQVHMTHHGVLLKLGTLSFRAQTPGLDYTLEDPPRVGDWVIMHKHTGHRKAVKIDPKGSNEDADNLIWTCTVTDTDIMEVGTYEQMQRIVGWV